MLLGSEVPQQAHDFLGCFGVKARHRLVGEQHLRALGEITDNTINFGSRPKFTFRLRPDGKMEGTRNYSGVLNTPVLIRDQSPLGP
jgi:hypothetical protein